MMAVIGLALQRGLAFATDAVILIAVQLLLGAGAVTARIPWGPIGNAAFLAAVVAYFGILEWRYAGRTPGKMLWRIRVARMDGTPPDAFAVFLRICLLVFGSGLAPALTSFLQNLLRLPPEYESPSTVAPLLVAWLVWPVSIIVGHGVFGAHDVLAGTRVVRASSQPSMVAGVPHLYWLKLAAVTGFGTLVVLLTVGSGTKPLRSTLSEPRTAVILQQVLVDHFTLARRAGDAGRLIQYEGDIGVQGGQAPDFMNDTTFVPAALRSQSTLVYEIPVTSEAYRSPVVLDTIGYALAGELVERFGAEMADIDVVLNFVITNRIGNCKVTLQIVRAAFFTPDASDPEGTIGIELRDPPSDQQLGVNWDTDWLKLSAQ
jgi:uncharacterized RDD family membrane protein YckC